LSLLRTASARKDDDATASIIPTRCGRNQTQQAERHAAAGNATARAAGSEDPRASSDSDRGRERQEEEHFNRKPTGEQLEAAITAWCVRFRRPNDPDIERQIGRQGVGRDLTKAAMSHLQVIDDKLKDHESMGQPFFAEMRLDPAMNQFHITRMGFDILRDEEDA
jgi:hypothetical protein